MHDTQMERSGITPNLDLAIWVWNEALSACQHKLGEHYLDDYMKATDELGQAISQWQSEQPELAEQFRLWFKSHWE
jgi:hypothetical protein